MELRKKINKKIYNLELRESGGSLISIRAPNLLLLSFSLFSSSSSGEDNEHLE